MRKAKPLQVVGIDAEKQQRRGQQRHTSAGYDESGPTKRKEEKKEGEEEEEERASASDDTACIYMSIMYRAGKLGVAHYNSADAFAYAMQCDCDAHEIEDILRMVYLQIGATHLIVPLAFAEEARSLIKSEVNEGNHNSSLLIRKAFTFGYERSRTMMRNMQECGEHLPSAKMRDADQLRDNFPAILLNQRALVSAAGGLVSELLSRALILQNAEGLIELGLRSFSLNDFVAVDRMTLQSLDAFSKDLHPNVHGSGHAKEGFSLARLITDSARSSRGKKLLLLWLRRPSLVPSVLERRYDGIDVCMHPENGSSIAIISRELCRVKNVVPAIKRLRTMSSQRPVNDWLTVHQFCVGAARIKDAAIAALKAMNVEESSCLQPPAKPGDGGGAMTFHDDPTSDLARRTVIHDIAEVSFSPGLVASAIEYIIDIATSRKMDRIVPNVGLDETLDTWRKIYDNLDEILSEKARMVIMHELPPTMHDLDMAVEYLPQIGYVIVVYGIDTATVHDGTHYGELIYLFSDADSCFFKSPSMFELDKEYGDVRSNIIDREIQIVTMLEERALEHEREISNLAGVLAELDATMALAQIASENGYCRPKLVQHSEGSVFRATKCRHPLLEMSLSSYIPNEIDLASDTTMMLITGPNFSGKSCVLKMIGLCTLMAHMGSYVPADTFEISCVDKLFTRIATVESCFLEMSTFTIDLYQMRECLRNSTSKSLILVDEFGKGTHPADGVALLVAVLERISLIRARTVVTTHFWEVFENDLLCACTGLAPFHMAVMETQSEQGSDEEIVPLFHLQKGAGSGSKGLECAQRACIPVKVLKRAREIRKHFVECTDIEGVHRRDILELGEQRADLQVATNSGALQSVDDEEVSVDEASSNEHPPNDSKKMHDQLIETFISIDDWEQATDEQVLAFCNLLKS